MGRLYMPELFRRLQAEGLLEEKNIQETRDGFFLAYKSLSDMLADKGIYDFPDSDGVRLSCDRFFDDWFLYAVANESDYTYSLLKLREQEHDAQEGAPADGDTPGVTISFIAFDRNVLLACLSDPADENRMRLDGEINRVVSRRGQLHHKALKRYFANPKSEGAYLVADTYTRHIASFAENGYLDVPDYYREIVRLNLSFKNSAKYARLPEFVESVNREAGYTLCDHEKIYINNPEALTDLEAAVILATHAGNTSRYSFAAEVEYHARFLIPAARLRIPFFGKSIYESAIRADMTVGDTEFEGPAPFYRTDSKIVKRQTMLHAPYTGNKGEPS